MLATAVPTKKNATPFHPANAAGTFAYQHGTFALRNEHVGHDDWRSARPNGVEAIENEEIKVRLVFANVDVACSDEHEPKAEPPPDSVEDGGLISGGPPSQDAPQQPASLEGPPASVVDADSEDDGDAPFEIIRKSESLEDPYHLRPDFREKRIENRRITHIA